MEVRKNGGYAVEVAVQCRYAHLNLDFTAAPLKHHSYQMMKQL
jgi:hypothetical protein